MKSFLKYLLASFLAVFLALIVLLLIGIGSVNTLMSDPDEEVRVKPQTVLTLNMKTPVTDRTIDSPLNMVNFETLEMSGSIGLYDILQNLEKAAADPNIEGLLIQTSLMGPGISTLQEIRQAILRFRESGKFVIAYGDFFTQPGYYLASAADQVYIHPEGVIEFRGLRSEVMFYTETLDKLGVEVQVMRHGTYKSAVEPFTETEMSEASKKQTAAYLDDIWGTMLADISASRGLSVDELNRLADGFVVREPASALENGFVDGLFYYDELQDALREKLGKTQKDKVHSISMMAYRHAPDPVKKEFTTDRIAIIYGSGSIGMSDNGPMTIGGDHLARAIRKARTDEKIKGIVFRVNSPGGNVLASDIIRREVELAAREKPLVISMGDYAASGGYWISSPADHIMANQTTLTGSIGVFGLWPNAGELLTETFGLHFDGVQTNRMSDMGSFYRPLKPEERAIIQGQIEQTYADFIRQVAEDRGMETAEVAAIGEGRVWSGQDAVDIGLVDETGGLQAALDWVASEAQLENYRIRELPFLKDPLEEILNQLLGKPNDLESALRTRFAVWRDLEDMLSGGPLQARLPYALSIR